MPLVQSTYHAPWLLRSGHLATIIASLLPTRNNTSTRLERLELADGDFLDLAWQQHPIPHSIPDQPRPLAVLSHGLEGSRHSPYILRLARTLGAAGWDVLSWNYRGCSGFPNRLARSYHSGESNDLRLVIDHAALTYHRLVLIGFSLGGNITLKYIGEAAPHPSVHAALAISAPVDLSSSAKVLDQRRGNRLYLRRFLKTLLAKAAAKSQQFPSAIDAALLPSIRTIRDFDEHITAPLHGFSSAADYWTRASALPHLSAISLPCLLLNAQNDPLLDSPSFPTQIATTHRHLHLETPAHGGHVGFLYFSLRKPSWLELRVLEFLDQWPVFS